MSNKTLPKITLELLKELSTPESFLRGRNYFQDGYVSNLKTSDNKFTAIVNGSYEYEVKISENFGEIDFLCTCPYDWGGICKHCVAVGLHILNNGEKIKKEKRTSKKKDKTEKIDILKVLDKATSKQKEEFLKIILQENSDYREKFFAFVMPQTELETEISIDLIKDQVIDILENFDLENYHRFYDRDEEIYGYRDRWDILYDEAIEELSNSLIEITSAIEKNMQNGNLIDAAKILLGLYEGCHLADCYEMDDPACIFDGDLNSHITSIFLDFYSQTVSSFPQDTLTSEASIRIMELFFQRIEKYKAEENFSYDLFLWRDFLDHLIIDKQTAVKMLSYLEDRDLLNQSTDIVQLNIFEITNQPDNWLKTANKYYINSNQIAQELLEYYEEKNRKKFIATANVVFKNSADFFADYLYSKLNIDEDRKLYKEILFHLAQRKKSISLFRQIRTNFDNDVAQEFIENAKGDSIFYINLLNEVKDYKTILQFVNNHSDSWDFRKIIKPILNIYPQECFEIINKKTDNYLKEHVGRKFYLNVANWLQLLMKIEDKKVKHETEKYLKELLQRYKMRPALKDELKKVGIK